jgi:hypothetical protein
MEVVDQPLGSRAHRQALPYIGAKDPMRSDNLPAIALQRRAQRITAGLIHSIVMVGGQCTRIRFKLRDTEQVIAQWSRSRLDERAMERIWAQPRGKHAQADHDSSARILNNHELLSVRRPKQAG